MKREFPKDLVIDALENAGFDEDNIYSGHGGIYPGRYGIRGAAVVLPGQREYYRFMLELGHLLSDRPELGPVATRMADTTHWDNMGRDDLVFCWPDTELTD